MTDNGSDKIQPDVPAFRFPLMHFCPKCGKLMPYWGFGDDAGHVCRACNKNIVPSRFVAACVNGHLEDFPYNGGYTMEILPVARPMKKMTG